MEETDRKLAKRVQDIVAVATDDIDAITIAVEDKIAYIEGVVQSEQQRRTITSAVQRIAGLNRVITCLAAEHVRPRSGSRRKPLHTPPLVMMYYHSLS